MAKNNNSYMDYATNLTHTRNQWLSKRPCLSESDVRFIAGKDSLKGKMLDLFSYRYFKRNGMIKKADVLYGYVIKEYRPEFDSEYYFPTWVLHSPQSTVQENPGIYAKIAANLDAYKQTKRPKEKLYCALTDNLYQTSFLEIPAELSEGVICYLSIVYCRKSTMPKLKLGMNLFLSNPAVSKELLYLPYTFWTDQWKTEY